MNVQYKQQGDYLIPCIRTKEQKEIHLGVWADRHRRYLKEYHKVRYYNLLTSEKLYDYLSDVERQAENLFEQTVKSLAEQEQKSFLYIFYVHYMPSFILHSAMSVISVF